ncbi:LytR/AlgR family response regulator transcription factor [Croceibacter atlanticus]|jgi:two-component system response regulator LytT|uniref:Two-component system response regulator n=1 Tax=Croceibacter atlanticus (strain ATCC BAA-628 / JCM 21780 / CIP 108009 / IAM 15332 / KCTC 12090 / HTCC2559) TaxID=216432 RepID=A3UA33_CROAH|nr:LytTR family DNA-binding domain-containing protein [Croceibacter atlanticus]EAP86669.1 two-component system response regulator [Croceibacter atlanticus HTCC2559]
MTSIIIDDEKTAREILVQLCTKIEGLDVIDEFSNAMDAIKFLNKNEIDLIFLDIHMPDFTGFDFIQTLRKHPKIILTTSDKNFAIEAFEYDCIVDYLVKPLNLERFKKAINKAEMFNLDIEQPEVTSSQTNQAQDKELFVNIDRRLIKIDISSIKLIQAKGDYILIKTDTKNFTVHSTLKKIVNKLPETQFLKVHRSYVINTSKIIDIEDNSVLIDKDVIPVSRSNRPELMRRLNLL